MNLIGLFGVIKTIYLYQWLKKLNGNNSLKLLASLNLIRDSGVFFTNQHEHPTMEYPPTLS